ncbi:MAG: acetyltransferase domain protein [Rhodospirillales bacterium]|nr:acetyltransferase domain protein [Rhodospirillales bacterium]
MRTEQALDDTSIGKTMIVRAAAHSEIDKLATLWFDGWQDAHAKILPVELARLRTLASFRHRLETDLAQVRVVGGDGEPIGFCTVKDDELYQLYVAAQARGSGAALALMEDAEDRLRDGGIDTAWLVCAIGNERAVRFYEKCGWRRIGTVVSQLPTPVGLFPLNVWRYEKNLSRTAGG